MKKTFSLVTVFMIALFSLGFGHTAFADEEEHSTIVPDQASTIDYTIKHETEDEDSAANGFFEKPATLLDINGERYVQLTVNSWGMIDSLQTENGDVLLVEENEDGNTALIQFKVDGNLADVLHLNMHITVPGLYSMEHDARLVFSVDSEEEIEIGQKEIVTSDGGNGPHPEQPEEPEVPEQPEENESDPSIIDLEQGSYQIDASYIRDDSDDPSAMGNYLENTLFLTVKENKTEVTITVNDDQTVTKLQIDGKDATEKVVDGHKRYETFTFDSLASIVDAYVEYQAPFGDSIHYGDAAFRISLDEESIQSADASEKPGSTIDEDKDEDKNEEDKNEDKDEDQNEEDTDVDDNKDTDKDTDKDNNKDENQDKVTTSQPDKAYEIDYIIKHATENKVSAADSFFKNPAYLLYKNDEKYLQLTVTNSDMIKSLKANNHDVIIVQENPDGSMVIQFKIDGDISQVIHLNMFVSVPDMPGAPGGYDMEHDARLFLDANSKKATDASKFSLMIDGEDNLNGPIVDKGNSGDNVEDHNGDKNNGNDQDGSKKDNTPEKPSFGSKGDTNDKEITPVKGKKVDNPKTGDKNQVFFLSLLLIGSLIPLTIKARKHFA